MRPRARPAAAAPAAMAGTITSRRYRGEWNGCAWNPSHTSPATRAIPALTPATAIGMSGWSLGPGEKKSVNNEKE